MKKYTLSIIDQIYIKGQAHGTIEKTIEIPFIPKYGMKIRKDGIQIFLQKSGRNFPESQNDIVYDCNKELFIYYLNMYILILSGLANRLMSH